ncbi:MAG: vanillate O-demethylase oxidoreductase VanB [Rhizobiales bacterium 17-65-6]|nr:MAG: vanillate O-demethylase oxidoreductase VanB [Rhizobiales bacterium 12-68-15]OZA00239.1 MAG: vanillate O-demethylase oxidoreductase VanB [Rhizobiales bacterium 17-65-6]
MSRTIETGTVADAIEKTLILKAPLDAVWRALTDHEAFGTWFRVAIDRPFAPGERSTGRLRIPGYEHVKWTATIREMRPQVLFSYTWHPYAVEADVDYSAETPTLVEFRLEPVKEGTRLTVRESGFDLIPAHRRPDAFRMNSLGWGAQMENVRVYVEGRD